MSLDDVLTSCQCSIEHVALFFCPSKKENPWSMEPSRSFHINFLKKLSGEREMSRFMLPLVILLLMAPTGIADANTETESSEGAQVLVEVTLPEIDLDGCSGTNFSVGTLSSKQLRLDDSPILTGTICGSCSTGGCAGRLEGASCGLGVACINEYGLSCTAFNGSPGPRCGCGNFFF